MIEKITHSDWAAPIVTVPKKDGTIRICGDYKVTVNPVLEGDKYPLPRIEDLFAQLTGGKTFTTLDMTHAYHQLVLDSESQKYVVVNTHRDCISTSDYLSASLLHPLSSRESWIRFSRV